MKKKLRYLIVGGWNTLFGYVVGVLLYKKYNLEYPVVVIAVASNIVAITMSFFTYKTLVFKTKGRLVKEYFRSYFVYGGSALISIFMLWAYVEKLGIQIEIAQALAIITTVVMSFFGHEKLTFKSSQYRSKK